VAPGADVRVVAQAAYELHEVDTEAYRKEAAILGVERSRREATGAYEAAEQRIAKRAAARGECVVKLDAAERELEEAEARLSTAMSNWESGLAALRNVEGLLQKDKQTAASLMGVIGDHDARLAAAEAAAEAARDNARKAREAFPPMLRGKIW
jgi:chromosome segregation ATPase